MRLLFVLAVSIYFAASAFSGEQKPVAGAKVITKAVFITGSLIPQRVQVRAVGTTTMSPVRIIDRHEIDGTGRFTTAGTFVNDPSVRVIGH